MLRTLTPTTPAPTAVPVLMSHHKHTDTCLPLLVLSLAPLYRQSIAASTTLVQLSTVLLSQTKPTTTAPATPVFATTCDNYCPILVWCTYLQTLPSTAKCSAV